MKKMKAVLAVVLAVAMFFGTAAVYGADDKVTRIGGKNRYDTAAQMAIQTFPEGATSAVLVSGENYPDALAASCYAGDQIDPQDSTKLLPWPILITSPKSLNPYTAALIKKLGLKKITIIGGYSSVSAAVENTLKTQYGLTVSRIYGKNRYETAYNVYLAMKSKFSEKEFNVCVIASGGTAADALSISTWAYSSRYPIFLANKDTKTLDAKSLAAVSEIKNDMTVFSKVYIVGSTSAVSADTEKALQNEGRTVLRLEGKNRYETSSEIASFMCDTNYKNVCFASGKDACVADSLVGCMFAGRKYAPIILVDDNKLVGLTQISQAVEPIRAGYVFGSEKSVSAATMADITKAINESGT